MKQLSDNSVNMILSDIPYDEVNDKKSSSKSIRQINKGNADIKTFEIEPFIIECIRVCSGSIYIFCGTTQISDIIKIYNKTGLTNRLCSWDKSNPSPMNGDKLWISSSEYCVFARKPKATFNIHCKGVSWRFPSQRSKIHPTQKPVALFEHLIKASTNEGDTVLDNCMGSGTTGVACLNTNRNFIGMELNEEYFNIAKNRIESNLNAYTI